MFNGLKKFFEYSCLAEPVFRCYRATLILLNYSLSGRALLVKARAAIAR